VPVDVEGDADLGLLGRTPDVGFARFLHGCTA
jgi:hypothetical protein